jgi:tetratricopeptide (TPR) repeat protein
MRPADVDMQKNWFPAELTQTGYQEAFAEYGLRLDSTDPAAADRLRGRPAAVRNQAVAALDYWLDMARRKKAPEVDWLEQALTAADPDDWRQRLRVARRQEDPKPLEGLAREVEKDVAAQPPQALLVLVEALRARGSSGVALQLLRRAQDAYPNEFWISHHLGMVLRSAQPPRLDEAIRFLTVAMALRPDSAGPHLNLGSVLEKRGRRDEAITAFRRAVKLKPDYAMAQHCLGELLQEQRSLPEAVEHYRIAAELRPGNAVKQLNLGVALMDLGNMPGAAESFRRALALDMPDPKFRAGALRNLGQVLQALGDVTGAVDNHRRAVELSPEDPYGHFHLDNALTMQRDAPGAVASYRRALGRANFAEAHCNLGDAFLRQGQFREALVEYKAGDALGRRRKDWHHPSDLWVKRCESFIALDGHLPANSVALKTISLKCVSASSRTPNRSAKRLSAYDWAAAVTRFRPGLLPS